MNQIGPKIIFIILFITLGPVKLIGPFAALTAAADRKILLVMQIAPAVEVFKNAIQALLKGA